MRRTLVLASAVDWGSSAALRLNAADKLAFVLARLVLDGTAIDRSSCACLRSLSTSLPRLVQMTRSSDDGFETDLPDGLFSTRDVVKAVHDADAAASITAALCRGLAIERAFQATVVRSGRCHAMAAHRVC